MGQGATDLDERSALEQLSGAALDKRGHQKARLPFLRITSKTKNNRNSLGKSDDTCDGSTVLITAGMLPRNENAVTIHWYKKFDDNSLDAACGYRDKQCLDFWSRGVLNPKPEPLTAISGPRFSLL